VHECVAAEFVAEAKAALPFGGVGAAGMGHCYGKQLRHAYARQVDVHLAPRLSPSITCFHLIRVRRTPRLSCGSNIELRFCDRLTEVLNRRRYRDRVKSPI
jgi:hypothetical protein